MIPAKFKKNSAKNPVRWQAACNGNDVMSQIRPSLRSGIRRISNWCLLGLLVVGLPWSAGASVSATLSWNASPDANVTGYTIYYGTASRQYTNTLSVGNMTNVVIPGLQARTTYFFAAKAHDAAGNQSDFSNEAAFAGLTATPDAGLRVKAMPDNATGDPLLFSFDGAAPAGATINPTNGIVSWTPGRAYASTTNSINILATDTVNPALSISETVVISVSDYLEFRVGATAVAAGQANSLPLAVASSSSLTNVQITLDWPGGKLLNPTLTFLPPVVSGSLQNQNNQLVLQLQTAPNQPLTGTNQVAQVNFQAAPGQASTIFSLPVAAAAGDTADGATYANVLAQPGEVVVVGADPLLRPLAEASHGRTLSLYANPGTYQLLYTTSLAAPVTWTPLMTYQQTNVAQTVSLDASEPVIFYRLQQL